MNWDEKAEMITLANKACDKTTREEFQKYVLLHIDNFDEQAWDMFILGSQLIPEEMQQDKDFYTKIYPVAEKFNESGHKLGFRGSLRVAMLLAICEENLGLKPTEVLISRKFLFQKEPSGRWYVVLPEWEGAKADLEMVAGADTMLDYMAEGKDYVNLFLSEEQLDGLTDKLEFVRTASEIGNGAHYKMPKYAGIEINLDIWLCDVTLFVFNNKFPETIYFAVIQE